MTFGYHRVGIFAALANAVSLVIMAVSSGGRRSPDGARVTLQTDNRKVDERAENGLVKLTRKSQWDGLTPVSEVEMDKGPSLERKYELSPGGTELHVSTTVSGRFGGGGGKRVIVQVYERPEEPAQ